MNQEDFTNFVLAGDASQFVVHRLFDNDCWVFSQPKLIAPGATYVKLKGELADLLRVMPAEIAVVGSGKFGWSMSPKKGVRPFNTTKSDLDIAIVSSALFEDSWSALRSAYYAGYSHYKEKHAAHVFARALVLDGKEKYTSGYLSDLAVRLSQLNLTVNKYVRLPSSIRMRTLQISLRSLSTSTLYSPSLMVI